LGISTNGYTYYSAGTESSYTGFLTSDLLFIRLTVNCSDGQTKTAYSSIYANYPGDGDFPEYRVVSKDKTDEKVVDSMVMVYPNPTSENIYLTSNFSEPKTIKVEIHSILRLESTLLLKKNIESGPQKQTINISKMEQGLYDVKVFDNNKEIFSTRMLIHRK
jgi:molybdopterin/thiamine biosynthesis adenylyltransferase